MLDELDGGLTSAMLADWTGAFLSEMSECGRNPEMEC